jgi:cardiolipin synthase
MPCTLPTLLTWLRVLAIPLLVGIYLWPGDALAQNTRNLLGTTVFVAAAVTDWLDGWLARRLGQVSAFGAFLDPVADKLLVCTVLVVLLALQRIDALVAVIIVGREIAISSLREWMASMGAHHSVAVHGLGKLKTASQLVALPLLLYHQSLWGVVSAQHLGGVLIYLAAALTLWSMGYYVKQAWPHLRDAR